jgi:hypothetical protein
MQIPELAGSWFLTIVQFVLSIYLLANSNTIVLPIEIAATVPLMALLLLQVLFGFRALQVRGFVMGVLVYRYAHTSTHHVYRSPFLPCAYR